MNTFRNADFGQYGKLNLLFEKTGDYDVVFFGSSRAAFHFNSVAIDSITGMSSCNMGIAATNDVISLGAINSYLSACKIKPKALVVNFDFFLWDDPSIDSIRNELRFFPYLHHEDLCYSLSELDRFFLRYKYLKPLAFAKFNDFYYYECYRVLAGKKIARDNEFKQKGFQKVPFEKAINFKNKNTAGNSMVSKRQLNAVERIFATASNQGLKLVPVITPVHSSYTFSKTDSLMLNKLYDLCNQYNVDCLNYLNKEICSNPSNFFDQIHLNSKGRKIFDKAFSEALIPLINN